MMLATRILESWLKEERARNSHVLARNCIWI
jgi:hypothetical protein